MNGNKVLIKERKRWGFFGLPFTFTTYTITDKKLLINSGLLSSVEDEILLYRIIDLTLKKTLFQKMFGLGTIIINAQDKTTPVLEIKNIKRVRDFKETLSNQMESEKIRLRVRKGEIITDGPNFDDYDDDYNNGYDDMDIDADDNY